MMIQASILKLIKMRLSTNSSIDGDPNPTTRSTASMVISTRIPLNSTQALVVEVTMLIQCTMVWNSFPWKRVFQTGKPMEMQTTFLSMATLDWSRLLLQKRLLTIAKISLIRLLMMVQDLKILWSIKKCFLSTLPRTMIHRTQASCSEAKMMRHSLRELLKQSSSLTMITKFLLPLFQSVIQMYLFQRVKQRYFLTQVCHIFMSLNKMEISRPKLAIHSKSYSQLHG